ncbi:MAG TPA: helix-turn-helix domain-containing protein [Candidatus Limnocylindria bacterium]
MGSSAKTDYCAFTKAVEHLGDRWSLLIVRELAQFGPQGFNTLATGLPGRVSRSVLTAKLRKLEEIGLLARDPSVPGRSAPYCLTPAGEQLVPTLMSLWGWAEQWVPEDPAMATRDPSVILWWLRHRVDPAAAPTRQVAIELDIRESRPDRTWLLLARDVEANLCLEDPMLGDERYVYVEAGADDLLPIARGQRAWSDAIDDRSVSAYGPPDLVSSMDDWFVAPASAKTAAGMTGGRSQ